MFALVHGTKDLFELAFTGHDTCNEQQVAATNNKPQNTDKAYSIEIILSPSLDAGKVWCHALQTKPCHKNEMIFSRAVMRFCAFCVVIANNEQHIQTKTAKCYSKRLRRLH